MGKGVVFVSRLPNGFAEDEMFEFFNQFGRVTRLKFFRSKKTGRCRGYAFVEFESKKVAEIASSTMNNYLLFDRVLRCVMITRNQLKPSTFSKWRFAVIGHRASKIHAKNINRKKSEKQIKTNSKRFHRRLVNANRRLTEEGINYQFKIPPIPDQSKNIPK